MPLGNSINDQIRAAEEELNRLKAQMPSEFAQQNAQSIIDYIFRNNQLRLTEVNTINLPEGGIQFDLNIQYL